jgi:L-lactate permease
MFELNALTSAFLYAVGVAALFWRMKRERDLNSATYEGLTVIAMLLVIIAVLLYYIYEKL